VNEVAQAHWGAVVPKLKKKIIRRSVFCAAENVVKWASVSQISFARGSLSEIDLLSVAPSHLVDAVDYGKKLFLLPRR
jgi:hypothetical protein